MKINNCNIINDLLPAFETGECSEDTKALVHEHLEECEGCRAALEAFGIIPDVPAVDEKRVLSNFSKKLKYKGIKTIFCTVLALLMLIGIVVLCAITEWSIAYSSDLAEVTAPVDGGLDICFSADNYKAAYANFCEAENGTAEVYITLTNNVFTSIVPDADKSDNLIRIGNGICVSYNHGGTVQFYVPENVENYRIYYVEINPDKLMIMDSNELGNITEKYLLW